MGKILEQKTSGGEAFREIGLRVGLDVVLFRWSRGVRSTRGTRERDPPDDYYTFPLFL